MIDYFFEKIIMLGLEKIAKVLKYKILKSEEGIDNKPSILFCGMDSYQKRDLLAKQKKQDSNLYIQ